MTYRGHIVYCVTNRYPTIAPTTAAIRPATRNDVLCADLGVLSDGRCLPLSAAEVYEIRQAVTR